MAARTEPGAEAPPGVRAALRRSRTLRVAAIAWTLLIGGLAAADGSAWQVPGWFLWGVATLLLPALVLFALVALPLLPFARLRRAGIAIGAVLATAVALLWALIAGFGVWLSGSPYAMFFWLDDGKSVAGFARRHPTLSVSTLTAGTMVRDGAGRAVRMERRDLAATRFAFEPCERPPLADRLGGLPPPPPPFDCRFRYRVARGGDERLIYVYERSRVNRADWTSLPNGGELPYGDWARARGAEMDARHVGGGPELTIRQGERIWQVGTVRTQFRHRVLIAEGGGPLHLPAPWEQGPATPEQAGAAGAPP